MRWLGLKAGQRLDIAPIGQCPVAASDFPPTHSAVPLRRPQADFQHRFVLILLYSQFKKNDAGPIIGEKRSLWGQLYRFFVTKNTTKNKNKVANQFAVQLQHINLFSL